jgi:hypothetical protein
MDRFRSRNNPSCAVNQLNPPQIAVNAVDPVQPQAQKKKEFIDCFLLNNEVNVLQRIGFKSKMNP